MTKLVVSRVLVGAAELLAPDLILRTLTGRRADPLARRVARVLGTREIAQAAVTALQPSRRVLVGGATVDGLHALSMLALAAANRQRRREALTSAAVAGVFAISEVAAATDRR